MEINKKYEAIYNFSPNLYILLDKIKYITMDMPRDFVLNVLYIFRNWRKLRIVKSFHIREYIWEYEEELESIQKDLVQLRNNLNYPRNFKINSSAGLLLYSVIRKKKPELVLETGVADGFSTRLILSALNKNDFGKLISVEIRRDVGILTRNINTQRWELLVGEPKDKLKEILESIKSLDVFLHDSDHSYENMLFEFKIAYKKLCHGGILISDDVQSNMAFIKLANETAEVYCIIASPLKCLGLLIKGSREGFSARLSI